MTSFSMAMEGGGLSQRSLQSRLSALDQLLQDTTNYTARSLISKFLSNPFTEKAWKVALLEAAGTVIQHHAQEQSENSIAEIFTLLEDEWSWVKSTTKAYLIVELFQVNPFLQEIITHPEHVLFNRSRALIMQITEFSYSSDNAYKSTFHRVLKQVVALFEGIEDSHLFPVQEVATFTPTQLIVYSQLMFAMKVSNEMYRSALLAEFVKKVVSAKAVDTAALAGFSALLGNMSQSEWEQHLEGPVSRMIKKAPESASYLVSQVLSASTVDLSVLVKDGMAASAIRLIKSAVEECQKAGASILTALSTHCVVPESFSTLVAAQLEALQGKGGILTTALQKCSILAGMQESVKQLLEGRVKLPEASVKETVKALSSCYEKEPDALCQGAYAVCLGHWIAGTGALSKENLALLTTSIKKSKELGQFTLLVYVTAVQVNAALVAELKPIEAALLEVVKESAKRPLQLQCDGVLAFYLLLRLSLVDSKVAEAISAAKLWSVTSSAASFLYSKHLLQLLRDFKPNDALLNGAVVEAIAAILSIVAANYPAHLSFVVDDKYSSLVDAAENSLDLQPGPFQTLLHLVLQENHRVRSQLAPHLSSLLQQKAAIPTGLLLALRQHIVHLTLDKEAAQLAELASIKKSSDAESTLEPRKAPSTAKFAEAVKLITGGITSIDNAALASLLLVVSNPLVSASAKTASMQWRLPSIQAAVATKSTEDFSSATSLVCSYMQTASASLRLNGHISCLLLHEYAGETGASSLEQQVLPEIRASLNKDNFANVSERDIDLYLNPVVVEAVVEEISLADIKITNEDRKKQAPRSSRKGAFGADLIEDEDWAEQIKKDKAKKLIEAKKTENVALQSKRELEVKEVQGRLGNVINRVGGSLQAMEFLARQCPELLYNRHDLILAVVQCLELRLVAEPAFKCVALLTSRLEPSVQSIGDDLANCLRIIYTQKDRKAASVAGLGLLEGPLLRSIRGLQVAVGRGVRFEAITVHFVALILGHVLTMPTLPTGCELTFMIYEHLWPNPADDARVRSVSLRSVNLCPMLRPLLRDFLATTLHVLARFRVEPSPETVLLRIASSVQLDSNEWSVLLAESGLLAPEKNVVIGCLKVILDAAGKRVIKSDLLMIETLVWLATNYEEEAVVHIAADCWAALAASISSEHLGVLNGLLGHAKPHVRHAAAKALGNALATLDDSQLCSDSIAQLMSSFSSMTVKKAKVVAEKEKGGKGGIPLIPKKLEEEDTKWPTRHAVCIALQTCCAKKVLVPSGGQVEELLLFLLRTGVVDDAAAVREVALEAGLALLEAYGGEMSSTIYGIIDNILNSREKLSKDEDHAVSDRRHEAAVILLGGIGRHLNKDDPNILRITLSLMEALNTPSERVQRAVADCLSPIIAVIKAHEKAQEFLEMLMTRLVNADTYGERRGAAFGLSAVIKGLGIASLKQYDLVNRLKQTCTEGSVNAREGSLFAFECLSDRLGLLFEPYVIPIVPILLKSFSHSSDHVREAAHMAAKIIMGKLSAHGVKQVLNPILQSLPEETQWKSRQESIRLLGAMAHLSPKSLATSLPQIIPRLVEAGNDVHPKVKESAKSAMLDISSVIKNPEVAELSPVLLEAIADPANKTKQALEVLLSCEFMHSIDAPSLALLVPILSRALKDRNADLKRKSSAIMGNITSMLSEPKIICPYLAQIIPGLKSSLLDPIPDVRAMSAKALGSLLGGVGEEEVSDLLPWLMSMLKTEDSPVERSGAAQGLAEVCLVLGKSRIRSILAEAILYQNHPKSAAREGLLWLLSFLPSVLNEAFAEHISTTLPVILIGLSDSSESVREVAMRSGRIMVQTMGMSHSLELLPSLRDGLFDEDSRIRHSSVTLLGELLYLVGDTKAIGLIDNDDDDEMGGGGGFESVSRVAASIKAAFGEHNTNKVLASLYVVRSDTTSGVRQMALQVWKSVVNNTPRTLVEVMPLLVDIVIANLSNEIYELKIMASRCLGEIVRKLGNKVLSLLVPCLQQGLGKGDKHTRQGICLGLSEILSALTKVQVETYAESLIPSLQQALCDVDAGVRGQAAGAFQVLSKCIGPRAIDEVVPALVDRLGTVDEAAELALLGLKEVVQLKPRDLLEYLLPRLLKSPIDIVSAKALATIAQVTGQHLHYHFQLIVTQLVLELSLLGKDTSAEAVERLEAIKAAASSVMGAVSSTGVNFLIIELGKHIENDNDASRRQWGCWLTEQFLLKTNAEFSEYVSIILKYLLSRVADRDREVLVSVIGALTALSNVYPVEEYVEHIDFIASCISSAASDARFRTASSVQLSSSGEYLLPLFTVPKSLDAFIPMLLYALTNGNTQVRESAATVIGELVVMCDADVLKPYLIKVTGPLIRVVGDRFPSSVKAAILETLCILLDRGGASLKAFAPQLQTTFVKSLNDPTKQVRTCASSALNRLVTLNLTARVDPLITELSTVIAQTDSNAIKSSVLDALASVLKFSASKASVSILQEKVEPVVLSNLEDSDEAVRYSAVLCIGQIAKVFTSDHVLDLLNGLLARRSEEVSAVTGRVLGAASMLMSMEFYDATLRSRVFDNVKVCFSHDDTGIRSAACSAVMLLLKSPTELAKETIDFFSAEICKATKDAYGDVRIAAIEIIKAAAKSHYSTAKKYTGVFMPSLIATIQDAANIKVKYTAERAMYYLLQGGQNPAVVNAYAATASGQDVAFVKDYARRILSKQPEDSEDEGSKW